MTDTRQRLLDATRRCIGAKGLAATTSRDITAEAEANLAAITYHFGSKDDLVAEALLEALRAWLTPTLDVLQGGGDPAARTMVAIQTLITTFDEHRAEAPAFLHALVEAPRIAPLQAGVVRLWDELRAVLAETITEMQQAGRARVLGRAGCDVGPARRGGERAGAPGDHRPERPGTRRDGGAVRWPPARGRARSDRVAAGRLRSVGPLVGGPALVVALVPVRRSLLDLGLEHVAAAVEQLVADAPLHAA